MSIFIAQKLNLFHILEEATYDKEYKKKILKRLSYKYTVNKKDDIFTAKSISLVDIQYGDNDGQPMLVSYEFVICGDTSRTWRDDESEADSAESWACALLDNLSAFQAEETHDVDADVYGYVYIGKKEGYSYCIPYFKIGRLHVKVLMYDKEEEKLENTARITNTSDIPTLKITNTGYLDSLQITNTDHGCTDMINRTRREDTSESKETGKSDTLRPKKRHGKTSKDKAKVSDIAANKALKKLFGIMQDFGMCVPTSDGGYVAFDSESDSVVKTKVSHSTSHINYVFEFLYKAIFIGAISFGVTLATMIAAEYFGGATEFLNAITEFLGIGAVLTVG